MSSATLLTQKLQQLERFLKGLPARKFLPTLSSFLTGLLWSLSTPLWDAWAVSFLVLVPLLVIPYKEKTASFLLKEGLWIQLIYCSATFFWSFEALLKLNHPHPALILSVFFLLMLLSQLPMVFFPLALTRIQARDPSKIKIFAFLLVFAFFDFIYPKPFNDTLGHAFAELENIRSWVSFKNGTLLLTIYMCVSNFLISQLVIKAKYVQAFLLWLALVFFTVFAPTKDDLPQGTRPLEVVAVNLHRPIYESSDTKTAELVFESIFRALQQINDNNKVPQLILFPETSYPFAIQDEKNLFNRKLKQLILEKDLHVILGGRIISGEKIYNAMIYLHSENNSLAVDYIPKRILFPFGESLPLIGEIPYFKRLFGPSYSSYDGSHKNFDIHGFKISTAICYESIFPSFVRQLADKPDLLVNASNEAYFLNFGEPDLSFALTAMKAAENNLNIIRVSNKGMAGFMSSHKIIDQFRVQRTTVKTYLLHL